MFQLFTGWRFLERAETNIQVSDQSRDVYQ